MSNKNKTLSEIIKENDKNSIKEHILNIFKAGLASTPFCGGIASLMNDYIPNSRQKRIEKFTEKLANDFNEIKDQISEENILNDEFAYIFEKCFKGAAENHQKDKLDAFRGILINSAIKNNKDLGEREYYLNLVNNLSPLHIRILKFLANPVRYLDDNKIPLEKIRGGFNQTFPIAIKDVDIEAIKSAFGDLYQYGLINTDKSIFGAATAGKGIDLVGKDGGRLSEFGQKFINFCTSPCDY